MSPSKPKYKALCPNLSTADEQSSKPSNDEQALATSSSNNSVPATHLRYMHEGKDPFISTSPQASVGPGQKLSATASAFQPFNSRLNDESQVSLQYSIPTNTRDITPDSPMSHGKEYGSDKFLGPGPSAPAQASGVMQVGTFSTDTKVSRALRITATYMPLSREQVEKCLQAKGIPDKATRQFYYSENEILVRFSDILDALIIYDYFRVSHPQWSVSYITPSEFAEKSNPGPFVSAYEAQISLMAELRGGGTFAKAKIEDIIVDLLAVDGVVYSYQKKLANEPGILHMVVEFCDVGSSHRAVARLNGTTIRGITFTLGLYKPDIEYARPRTTQSLQHASLSRHTDYDMMIGGFDRMSITSPQAYAPQKKYPQLAMMSPTSHPHIPGGYPLIPGYSGTSAPFESHYSPQSSVTGLTSGAHCTPTHQGQGQFASGSSSNTGTTTPIRNAWKGADSPFHSASKVEPLQRGRNRRQNAIRASRPQFNNNLGQHNVVDINRIREGLDVRTTIMLRNIPNKVDQKLLKEIVDETSFGLYDFMYLRIDFANNCNVGYAFINFEDPWHIINFVEARSGQRWNRYNSDKVAEISYATIQGKDCLVQKFRNSSVMLEHPTFRPKIFRTGNHPDAGQEDDFPLPDNISKMRRSVENAEHVGLFAPRAGQHYRDEQRRRHSQFDRGTRLAALEEFEYEDSSTTPGAAHYTYYDMGENQNRTSA